MLCFHLLEKVQRLLGVGLGGCLKQCGQPVGWQLRESFRRQHLTRSGLHRVRAYKVHSQVPGKTCVDLFGVYWFVDEITKPHIEILRTLMVKHRRRHRNHHRRIPAKLVEHALQSLGAVHHRHANIQKHDVRHLALNQIQRLYAVLSRLHFHADFGQHLRENIPVGPHIIHDQCPH